MERLQGTVPALAAVQACRNTVKPLQEYAMMNPTAGLGSGGEEVERLQCRVQAAQSALEDSMEVRV